jgi:hypothetical protein
MMAWLASVLDGWSGGGTSGRPTIPLRKYRVTPRQNAWAFRRALLRSAILQLKQPCVTPLETPDA